MKSVLHTIICVFMPLYDYRGEVLFYKDVWKNKCIKKRDIFLHLHGHSSGCSTSPDALECLPEQQEESRDEEGKGFSVKVEKSTRGRRGRRRRRVWSWRTENWTRRIHKGWGWGWRYTTYERQKFWGGMAGLNCARFRWGIKGEDQEEDWADKENS